MERIAFVINKLSFVTNDTRPAISYENINDLARSEKASLEPPEPLRNRFESGKRNEENAETAFASYTANWYNAAPYFSPATQKEVCNTDNVKKDKLQLEYTD